MENEVLESQQKFKLVAQIGLLMGPFLSMVDSNIVNVALPDIAKSLNSNLTDAQWIVSGYMLALAACLALSAFLAKRFGTLNVYRICLLGFTAGSAFCALSTSMDMLIFARIVQGSLGAPLIPLAMSMIFGGGDKSKSKDIPPVLGMMLFFAPALGPTIGGSFLHFFDWYSVFWINVPIGLIGFLCVITVPKMQKDAGDPSIRFDPVGLIMLSAGLTGVVYGSSKGPLVGWKSDQSWPYWVGGAVLLILYGIWAYYKRNPAVDLKLFRRRYSALSVILCALTSVIMFSIIVIVPLFMETVQGKSPLNAGLTIFPQALVMGIGTAVGGQFAKRFGVRISAVVGLTFLTIGSALLLLINEDTSEWLIAVLLLSRGLGIGLVIQQLLSASLEGLDAKENTDANTLFNISERIGGAAGVALVVTYLQTRLQTRLDETKGASGNLFDVMKKAMVTGFHDTFLMLTILAFIGLLAAVFFLRKKQTNTVADQTLSQATGK